MQCKKKHLLADWEREWMVQMLPYTRERASLPYQYKINDSSRRLSYFKSWAEHGTKEAARIWQVSRCRIEQCRDKTLREIEEASKQMYYNILLPDKSIGFCARKFYWNIPSPEEKLRKEGNSMNQNMATYMTSTMYEQHPTNDPKQPHDPSRPGQPSDKPSEPGKHEPGREHEPHKQNDPEDDPTHRRP